MPNWVPLIQHITDGENVDQETIGRVAQALQARTDYLFTIQNELVERRQRLQIDGVACDSLTSDYKIGFLSPITSLVELADSFDTSKALAVGVIKDKANVVGGFTCNLVSKGLLDIPNSELANFVTEDSWQSGSILFLDGGANAGKVTFVEPPLSIPMGISLPQNSNGDYPVILDPDPYLNLQHRHIREAPPWELGGMYTLIAEPTSPAAVFVTVDETVLKFDDDNVGAFTTPGDPDYSVSGVGLTVYSPPRFFVNPIAPKIVIWYTTPFGESEGVTGLIAGHNITLSSCDINGAVAKGLVTVNSKQDLFPNLDGNDDFTCVKNITLNPPDFGLIVRRGKTVNKLFAGINIYFENDDILSPGQGNFTINARPDRNSFELLSPESIFLDNAKEDDLFERFHAYVLEATTASQSAILKFRIPEYINSGQAVKLRLEYMVDSASPGNNTELQISYLEVIEGITSADAALTSITDQVPFVLADFKKLKSHEIDVTTFSANSTLVMIISRTRDVVNDDYEGNFNIVNTRLRIVPTAV